MKCFCTNCGKGSEFFGEKNRPKICSSCSSPFLGNKLSQAAKEETLHPEPLRNNKIILDGDEYGRSFFLDILTMSYEKDHR